MVNALKEKIVKWFKRICKSWSALFAKTSNWLSLSNVITRMANFSIFKYISILIVLSALGMILNTISRNQLPYFNVLLLILIFCQISSHYTTVRINKICEKLNTQSMIGQYEQFVVRQKFTKRLNSNLVYIPTLFFGFIIPTAAFQLINIEVDLIVCAYCFFVLSVVTMSCTVGAIHFLFLLMFMHNIRINAHKINGGYDTVQYSSIWLNDLISISGVCNKFFSLVGTAFILAFCLFSFSGKYCIDYSDIISVLCIAMFWFIIVIFIILGAIVASVWSRITIRKTVEILLSNAKKNLYDEFLITNDLSLKIEKGIRLSLLNINQSKIFKLNRSYFAMFISIINFAASLEATVSLMSMMFKDIFPLSTSIMYIFERLS